MNSIIRTEKVSNFSQIDNVCLKDSQLSLRAKGLFAYLMSLPPEWQVSKKEVAKHFKDSYTIVSNTFKELEQAGYVTETAMRSGGKFSVHYTIYESLRDKGLLTGPGKPVPVLPVRESEYLIRYIKNSNTYKDTNIYKSNIQEQKAVPVTTTVKIEKIRKTGN